MTRRQQHLLDQLLRAARVMLQGSLSETTRTCGHPTCRCRRGQRHGPHTYLTFRTPEGRSSAVYVSPAALARVRQGVAAWGRFWQVATRLAQRNREALGRRRPSGGQRRGHARPA